MGDTKFDRLLKQLGLVIGSDSAAVAGGSFWNKHTERPAHQSLPPVPAAANDNKMIWPVIPFPEGWTVAS